MLMLRKSHACPALCGQASNGVLPTLPAFQSCICETMLPCAYAGLGTSHKLWQPSQSAPFANSKHSRPFLRAQAAAGGGSGSSGSGGSGSGGSGGSGGSEDSGAPQNHPMQPWTFLFAAIVGGELAESGPLIMRSMRFMLCTS